MKYVLYLRNLQLHMQLGMKVHRSNAEKCKETRSYFEKDLYKLISNAVYGKTIKQLHSRTHIKLISDPEMAKCYIWKPTCKTFHIINGNLTVIHLGKRKIQMNKPIFAGMVILDIAKMAVFSLHVFTLQLYSKQVFVIES